MDDVKIPLIGGDKLALFNEGKYKHKDGYTLLISNGDIFLTPSAPMSFKAEDVFTSDNWTEITTEGSETNGSAES